MLKLSFSILSSTVDNKTIYFNFNYILNILLLIIRLQKKKKKQVFHFTQSYSSTILSTWVISGGPEYSEISPRILFQSSTLPFVPSASTQRTFTLPPPSPLPPPPLRFLLCTFPFVPINHGHFLFSQGTCARDRAGSTAVVVVIFEQTGSIRGSHCSRGPSLAVILGVSRSNKSQVDGYQSDSTLIHPCRLRNGLDKRPASRSTSSTHVSSLKYRCWTPLLRVLTTSW